MIRTSLQVLYLFYFSSEVISADSHNKIDLFSLHKTKEFFANETKETKVSPRKDSKKSKVFSSKNSQKLTKQTKGEIRACEENKILSASYGIADVTQKVRELVEKG